MSPFKQQLTKTLEGLANPPVRAPNEFDSVLEEFAEFLNQNEDYLVGAAVEPGSRPEQRALVTWPRYLRNSRSVMLTFWFSGRSVEVEGGKTKKFTKPGALQSFLVDFLKNSDFPSTLKDYTERCSEDVAGLLRVEGNPDQDVFAVVPGETQATIAQAALAGRREEQSVKVRTNPGPLRGSYGGQIGRPAYDPQGTYVVLASGGFEFEITRHQSPAPGEVVLEGHARPV
ncbi:MAG: hypothetical protein HY904_19100 [Deltaproteobacteria bacterium]|nr:hypothetical protein [Deltaproteobacteria bacterium]